MGLNLEHNIEKCKNIRRKTAEEIIDHIKFLHKKWGNKTSDMETEDIIHQLKSIYCSDNHGED